MGDSNSETDQEVLLSCFECESGKYEVKLLGYETTDGCGQTFVVQDVPHMICDKCGDYCLSDQASRMIDAERIKRGVVLR